MNWVQRKIVLKLTPTILFSFPTKDKITIEYQTIVKNMIQTYDLNGITKHKGIDSIPYRLFSYRL